jgi:hypothetical protein
MEAVHNNTSIASHMLHHISPNGQKVSTSKDAEKGITNIPRSMSEQASDTIYVFVFVRNFLVVITAIITKLFPAKTTILIMVKVNVVGIISMVKSMSLLSLIQPSISRSDISLV